MGNHFNELHASQLSTESSLFTSRNVEYDPLLDEVDYHEDISEDMMSHESVTINLQAQENAVRVQTRDLDGQELPIQEAATVEIVQHRQDTNMSDKDREKAYQQKVERSRKAHKKYGTVGTDQTESLIKSIQHRKKLDEAGKLKHAENATQKTEVADRIRVMKQLSSLDVPVDIFDYRLDKEHKHFDVKKCMYINECLNQIAKFREELPLEYSELETDVYLRLENLCSIREEFAKALDATLRRNGVTMDGRVIEEGSPDEISFEEAEKCVNSFMSKCESRMFLGDEVRLAEHVADELEKRTNQANMVGNLYNGNKQMAEAAVSRFRSSSGQTKEQMDLVFTPTMLSEIMYRLDANMTEAEQNAVVEEHYFRYVTSQSSEENEVVDSAFEKASKTLSKKCADFVKDATALVEKIISMPIMQQMEYYEQVLKLEMSGRRSYLLGKATKNSSGESIVDQLGYDEKKRTEIDRTIECLSAIRLQLTKFALARAPKSGNMEIMFDGKSKLMPEELKEFLTSDRRDMEEFSTQARFSFESDIAGLKLVQTRNRLDEEVEAKQKELTEKYGEVVGEMLLSQSLLVRDLDGDPDLGVVACEGFRSKSRSKAVNSAARKFDQMTEHMEKGPGFKTMLARSLSLREAKPVGIIARTDDETQEVIAELNQAMADKLAELSKLESHNPVSFKDLYVMAATFAAHHESLSKIEQTAFSGSAVAKGVNQADLKKILEYKLYAGRLSSLVKMYCTSDVDTFYKAFKEMGGDFVIHFDELKEGVLEKRVAEIAEKEKWQSYADKMDSEAPAVEAELQKRIERCQLYQKEAREHASGAREYKEQHRDFDPGIQMSLNPADVEMVDLSALFDAYKNSKIKYSGRLETPRYDQEFDLFIGELGTRDYGSNYDFENAKDVKWRKRATDYASMMKILKDPSEENLVDFLRPLMEFNSVDFCKEINLFEPGISFDELSKRVVKADAKIGPLQCLSQWYDRFVRGTDLIGPEYHKKIDNGARMQSNLAMVVYSMSFAELDCSLAESYDLTIANDSIFMERLAHKDELTGIGIIVRQMVIEGTKMEELPQESIEEMGLPMYSVTQDLTGSRTEMRGDKFYVTSPITQEDHDKFMACDAEYLNHQAEVLEEFSLVTEDGVFRAQCNDTYEKLSERADTDLEYYESFMKPAALVMAAIDKYPGFFGEKAGQLRRTAQMVKNVRMALSTRMEKVNETDVALAGYLTGFMNDRAALEKMQLEHFNRARKKAHEMLQ